MLNSFFKSYIYFFVGIVYINISAQTVNVIDNKGTIQTVDANSENEIQDLNLDATTNILTITLNSSATEIDLSTYLNTDNQTIQTFSFNATTNVLTLTLENGGTQTINLSALEESADILANTNAITLKEDTANKSTTTTLGTSDILFPTQNAVKTYVDGQIAALPTDSDSIIGNEVTGATTGGSLVLGGTGVAGDPYTLDVADGGINTTELADDAVTLSKLANGTANGQVFQWNSTNSEWELTTLSTSNNAWGILGNSGTNANTNFLGTTDTQDLVFKVNNSNAGRIYTNGSLTLGLNSSLNNTSATAIGGSSNVYGNGGTAIGNGTSANTNAVSLGHNASSSGTEAIAIGETTNASGNESVAIGHGANTSNGVSGIAIGDSAQTSSTNGIAIGTSTNVYGTDGIAIGNDAQAAQNSVAIGAGINVFQSNTIGIGTTNQNVGVGTNTPTASLDVDGTARIRNLPDEDQSNYIVTADNNGNLQRKTIRVLDVYDNTGGQTFTTTLTRLNLDIERTNLGFASISNDVITIPEDGVYRITYSVTYTLTLTNSSQLRTGAKTELQIGGVAEPGSDIYSYHRINRTSGSDNNRVHTATSSRTIIKTLSAGNTISLHGQRYEGTGTLETIAGGTGITIEKLN